MMFLTRSVEEYAGDELPAGGGDVGAERIADAHREPGGIQQARANSLASGGWRGDEAATLSIGLYGIRFTITASPAR